MSALAGARVLLVEDEYVIAQMAADMLAELGASVVGPAGRLAEGMRLAEIEALDAAVLDVNLRGERVDPVAEVLAGRGIPFVLATGYGEVDFAGSRGWALIEKPYTQWKLAEALSHALAGSPRNGPASASL